MTMTPADYVFTWCVTASGILVTGGYGLLYRGRAWFTTIRVCFCLAAAALAGSAFVWAIWLGEQQLWIRIVVATLVVVVSGALLAIALRQVDAKNSAALDPALAAIGGKGGNAKTSGRRSQAIGGRGGRAGVGGGIGGEGGSAEAGGDDSIALGGDGGNAGEPSGRGGRRPLSAGERLNLSTDKWGYGVGGRGANAPEYDRRLQLLIVLRARYFQTFPQDVIFIQAGVDQVPTRWINKCLEEMGESWRVLGIAEDGGYAMPPL
jgi:hypothetical protein